MFDMNDILARLQNGETSDEIANEMAAALNDAQKAFDEETKRIAEEEAKANAVVNAKREAARNIFCALADYCLLAGCEGIVDELRDMDDETLDKLISEFDKLFEFAKMLDKLDSLEFPRVEKKKPAAGPIKVAMDKDADAIIKAFLKGL